MKTRLPYKPIVIQTDDDDSKIACEEHGNFVVKRFDVILDSQNVHKRNK